jgi:hypothetical protein
VIRLRPHLAALILVLVAALAAAPSAPAATSWTDADYWSAVDRLQERIDRWWVSRRGLYKPGDLSADTMVNANMLLVHSVAALHGHHGPSRQDDRARVLAGRLLESPPFVAEINPEAMNQVHAPGWMGSTTAMHSIQHLVVDAEVAEALAAAWRARDVIGLPPQTTALIAQRLREVARGSFWRYPAERLNQINWFASIYAAAAETNGDPSVLQRDLRAQVARFVHRVLHPGRGKAGNLAGGMRFQYLPDRHADWALNFDSPEYGNLVASFARTWDWARAAGMADLAPEQKAIVRRWMTRVLAGYWTHSGYLNWDTGFGFRRLHQAKKLPLAQQGLLAIAAGGDLTPGPVYAAWAKSILDRGIALYVSWIPAGDGLPPALLFDLSERPQPAAHAVLAAGRVAANAARAVQAGLGSAPSQTPPPLYAYDPDVGRLAVTTPRYSTAIVPVNQGAFPYGGLEIARLFDSRQEVAGNIGGVPPAAFGMVVRNRDGRTLLATQRPSSGGRRGAPALRLVRAPSGVGVSPRTPPTRAFAGRFHTLTASGAVRRRGVTARSTTTFRRSTIDIRWRMRAARGAGRSVEVQLPSWGGANAHVWAVARGGRAVEVTGPRSLRGVRWLYVESEQSGYAVVPRSLPQTARALLLRPARQPSAPRPGPTLILQLARDSRARAVDAAVRLIPARDLATAKSLVARLG